AQDPDNGAPILAKGRTFVESLIPCSHGGRALVVEGVEEMENVEVDAGVLDHRMK
ncbi:hypothetical protein BHE74_00059091, partial [Ensete ventricosum]